MIKTSRRGFLGMTAGSAAAVALGAPYVRASDSFTAPAKLNVGIVPYISMGPYFIAKARGYFDKVNLEVTDESFQDGGLAIPILVAGRLDVTVTTCNAGLFNTISKGAPFRIFTDRGRESAGLGSQAMIVSNKLYEKGFTNLDGYKHMAGEVISLSVRGSISQFLHEKALERAGLKSDDAEWRIGMDLQTTMQLIGQNEVGLSNLPVPLCFAMERRGAGRIVTWGDEIVPDVQLACWAASNDLLENRTSVAVRYAMVHLHSVREFIKAAQDGDAEIVKILAEATRLPEEVIDGARPRWTGYALDGIPNVASIMEQAQYWKDKGFVAGDVTQDQVLTLDIVREANRRLEESNPFV